MMKKIYIVLLAVTAGFALQAQNYCAGLKNPTSFVITGSNPANASWTGYTGSKNPQTSTCTQWGMSFTGSAIPANQLASQSSGSSCTSSTSVDINNQSDTYKRFVIKGTGTDPLTYNHLAYQPPADPSFIRSIRLGNNCGGTHEAEMLVYQFDVVPQNALIIIWYALSLQNGQHATADNPEFCIQVERKNPTTNQWQRIGGDTLCYTRATPASPGTNVEPFYRGQTNTQTGATYGENIYLPWNKVSISLNRYLYQTVRIKIGAGDCSMSVHYGCCYIAGECQPMQIQSSGCPAGFTSVIDTLKAPEGLGGYAWYRSLSGAVEDIYNVSSDVQFQSVNCTTNTYLARLNDFILPNGDTVNTQTFKCVMTSAMNPAIPFTSTVYVNVDNAKPSVALDTVSDCDGNIYLTNRSFSGTEQLDPAKTRWRFYEDTTASGAPISTIMGDTVNYHFSTPGWHSVMLYVENARASAETPICYTEKKINVRTLSRPEPAISVNPASRELCLNQECTISDITPGSTWRMWAIPRENGIVDTTYNQQSIVRAFDYDPVHIYLTARNGQYYLNPADRRETIWCEASTQDVIHVFTAPELHVSPDTIVCNGKQTHVTISTDVEGCTYTWYRHLNQAGENPLQTGNVLRQTPYADVSTYYVKVTSPQGCEAWDSVTVRVVRPELSITPADGRICFGEIAHLRGSQADHYSWEANPYDATLVGQEDYQEIHVSPTTTTVYTMTGHGSDGCDADPLKTTVTVLPYPVPAVSVTPGFVDSENPVVKFSDVSPNSTASLWDFGNGQTSSQRTVEHTFTDLNQDSAQIRLRTSNALGCSRDTVFSIPIQLFSVWFPTAFTPNLEYNNIFRLYTANQLEYFRLFIYDRRGALVYFTEDQNFEWDGTSRGRDLPQGAYVYTCTYRRPGTSDVVKRSGTIMLIR